MKHFLKETDFAPHELPEVFNLAQSFKKLRGRHTPPSLAKQSWGMLFYKNSTRTRVSFEVGIQELGGYPLVLSQNQMQISRGESIEDTAKILSRYLHGLVIRCFEHSTLEEFARGGSIPVVNALSDFLHPCQIYSDALTLGEIWSDRELKPALESLKGKKLVFYGDTACNMANSWLLGGNLFGMEIVLCGPEEFQPEQPILDLLEKSGFGGGYSFTSDPKEAAEGADVIYTDVWVSMGDEAEAEERVKTMAPYQVNMDLLSRAKSDAIFLHCLPAHPDMEVTQEVLDSKQSVIFDQAENRLHMQKAILAALAEANKKLF